MGLLCVGCSDDSDSDCHANCRCVEDVGSKDLFVNLGHRGDGKIVCDDTDECAEGTDDCHENAYCMSLVYVCKDKDGFSGDWGILYVLVRIIYLLILSLEDRATETTSFFRKYDRLHSGLASTEESLD